jgi:hypothetical protein
MTNRELNPKAFSRIGTIRRFCLLHAPFIALLQNVSAVH